MEINKYYIIKTGKFYPDEGDKEVKWSERGAQKLSCGYSERDFYPFDNPMFTTFEEADEACRNDWCGMLYEEYFNYAKVLEYTMGRFGDWNLTKEWVYSTDAYNVNESNPVPYKEGGIYSLFYERSFSNDGLEKNKIQYRY